MQVILIATQKGGAGKSTLAAHFGALAARDGRTLLVDADPQGSLSFWHRQRAAEAPQLVQADAAAVPDTLERAKAERAEWVVIDSPPHNAPLISSLMSRASLTLIPVRPGPFDLDAVGATLAMARSLGARIACLINAAPPMTRLGRPTSIVAETRTVLTDLGAPVLPGQVSQRASLSHALISGQSVGEYDPGSRAAEEVGAMWSTVVDLVRPAKARRTRR
ncbi:chromosome partitioning protein [Methylobacterium sp. BE186]|uniref:ParA family protein n=1 Tax=Methylobacterium sp. BE186 TaxID=2817715 RepID=UPI002859409A|nr:ParA family protein [Methylobacterium sp. BE186]MDR7037319.1 chromosome partitioning protein [Methylobacterium sp. BE186]